MYRDEVFSGFPYLLIGIGFGIVASLLLAPRSGEELRQDVRRRATEGLDYINQQAEKFRDSTDKVVAKGKEWIDRQSQAVMETRKPHHEQI